MLLLIVLAMLLRLLRLPVILLRLWFLSNVGIQGTCVCRIGPMLGRQASSKLAPPRMELGRDRRRDHIDEIRRIHRGKVRINKYGI